MAERPHSYRIMSIAEKCDCEMNCCVDCNIAKIGESQQALDGDDSMLHFGMKTFSALTSSYITIRSIKYSFLIGWIDKSARK